MMNYKKNVLVLGFARSGYSVSKLLLNYGANVFIYDSSELHDDSIVSQVESLGAKTYFGNQNIDLIDKLNIELIVKSPGVPLDNEFLTHAINNQIEITTEIEVAYNCMSDAKFIAITGTNGKTTSSTLIYKFLKQDGFDVHLTGNIGNPLSNYFDKYDSNTIFVVEISAQQLYDCKNFHANVAILTNLFEAHLEFFQSVELYYNMKKRVFNNMSGDDLAIINADDLNSLSLTFDIDLSKKYFSLNEKVVGGYKDKSKLIIDDYEIDIDKIKLVGNHNYSNILCAVIAAKYYNVSKESINLVLESFHGVSHRLEYVRSINGVKFYNDSKSTNIDSCKVALKSFDEPVVLILGGLERGQEFEQLLPDMNYVNKIYAYGETAQRICKTFNKYKINCEICNNLQEATVFAHDTFHNHGVVLLSPACASWDQFKDFEERGDMFKLIVNAFTE